MRQLTKEDSGEYRLRIIIQGGRFSGKPGVVLNVTDLQVRLSHYAVASEEQTTVTLGCITSCTLPNSPIYMWYKNGQPVISKLTKHNKLYLISSEDAGNYSCAVKGRDDLRSPEQIVTFPEVGLCSECPKGNNIGIIAGAAVVLVLIIIAGSLWIWRRKSKSGQSQSSTEDSDPQSGQVAVAPQDDVHYSSILFSSRTQGSSQPTQEHEQVQYAEVNLKRPAAAI
ncbi:sialoadhesin [Tachysurus ichikawai]